MPGSAEARAPGVEEGEPWAPEARHKYVVVFGTCCTADALRPRDFADIRDSNLRLLWYQGRSSYISLTTSGLAPDEVEVRAAATGDPEVDWNRTMAVDEIEKRQQARLEEVVGMSDGLVLDVVSAFSFPYLVVEPEARCFLESQDWQAWVKLRAPFERRRLWDFPLQLSLDALRRMLTPLYELQPELRLIFHLPKPCFNDGVDFEDPELGPNLDCYHAYGERMFEEAQRSFPRVRAVACGGERADPDHANGVFPFHYRESYMKALRAEILRLLE